MTNSTSSTNHLAAWIGLDWADHKHALSLQAADGSPVEHYQVEQARLAEWVAQLQARWPGRTVALALEQSRGAVWYTLMGYAFLELYPINPKSLARFRETFAPSGSKDDPQDADLLREMIQKHADRLRPWKADTVQTRQLQLLVEYRRQSVDERTRLMNQATSLLKCYYPLALETCMLNVRPSMITISGAGSKPLRTMKGAYDGSDGSAKFCASRFRGLCRLGR